MTMLKLLSVVVAVAVGFAVGAYGVAYGVASRASHHSASSDIGFTVPRTDYPTAETQVAFWSKRVGEQPDAYLDLTLLGQAFAREGRETSDIDDYVRAESALRRALRINPGYVQARAALAGVLLSVHEFRPALATAGPIVGNPRGVQALATVGDARMALGDYSGARSAYARLLAWAPTAAEIGRAHV